MDLGYFAADTLGVTLYQINGSLVANEVHSIALGPWKIDLSVDVTSDLLTGTELGFWVTLGKTLKCYVVIRDKENWLFVMDSSFTFLGSGNATLKERLLMLKPAYVAAFSWKGDGWKLRDAVS